MEKYNISKYKHFYVIGISYKKADACMRGLFNLDLVQQEAILQQAQSKGMDALMIISTCNRTELYGFAQHPFELIQMLCMYSKASVDDFQKVGYVYKNKEAFSHAFNVGTGLDSQILGDFEIIGQFKKSFALSKEYGLVNAFMERLQNAVIQASKRIKTETGISSGATSVSFASVQYILNNIPNVSQKNILLFGMGEIGRNTCENLVKHTDNKHITLINRSKDKAEEIAGKFNVLVKDFSDLELEIKQTDILIVATGANKPTITKSIIPFDKKILILDLSIPKNVEDTVQELPNVTLIHLDYLSQITDETFEKRKLFIPQAQQIINEVMQEFYQWLESRRYAPAINALKKKLEEIRDAEMEFQRKKTNNFNQEQVSFVSDRIIQRITGHFMNHLKETSMVDESLDFIEQIFQLQIK